MLKTSKAAAVCYRLTDGGQLEILLVRNSAGDQWVFPKGTVEAREAFGYQAAVRESWEEAGVRGRVDPRALGTFRHAARSKKTNEINLQVVMAYALQVADLTGVPEPGRNPTWFGFAEAELALQDRQDAPETAGEAVRMLHLLAERLAVRPG